MKAKLDKLLETIIHYSCEIKSGDKVVLEYLGLESMTLVKALIAEIHNQGATVAMIQRLEATEAAFINESDQEAIENWMQRDLDIIKDSDVYIMIKSPDGENALGQVTPDKMALYQTYYYKPFYNVVLNKMRWLSMRFPSVGLAKNAGMTLESFESLYYDLCQTDYSQLTLAMDALVDLMSKTQKVKILGEGTKIEFELGDIAVHKCDGRINLPDGEVYTAPIKSSLNGVISFNVPSYYQGKHHEDIVLTFENGKVVSAISKDTKSLESVISTDEGASYVGEFALGVNPYITKPLGDILFDEKIAGSFHFALGNCYEDASNGNHSSIHWDLICIQTEDRGGGEIYFDDVLIRKDGQFLIDNLKALN